LEYNDGHKTVDIAILDAKLFIEVDGLQHFTKPEQILRDFKRSHYSDGDDFRTFYVTNQIIEKYLNEVADALVKVVEELRG
jgi:very-short-patch-repair endonuclease